MSAQPIDPRALKAAQQFRAEVVGLSDESTNALARIIQSHFAESVNGKLLEALNALVAMYVANLGKPESEFISCWTPKHASEMTPEQRKKNKVWKAWDAARDAITLAQSQPPSMDKFDPACGDCDPCIGGRPDQCALFPTKTNMADELAEALRGVINGALHPEKAVRRVMVDLRPIRELLARYDAQKGRS